MPRPMQHTNSDRKDGLFPLSPELVRRLVAEHEAQVTRRQSPVTPELEDV